MTKEYVKFVRHIKNDNIYHLWRREILKQKGQEGVKSISNTTYSLSEFITWSFIWSRTSQGDLFWGDIYLKYGKLDFIV